MEQVILLVICTCNNFQTTEFLYKALKFFFAKVQFLLQQEAVPCCA